MAKKLIFGIILTLLSLPPINAQLKINEVMQANTSLIDDTNNFPDSWIELYNESGKDISLFLYTIESSKAKYTIYIDTIVKAHSFIVLYADELCIKLHTNFKVEFEKESSLKLYAPDSSLADIIYLSKCEQPGIAYGRNNKGEYGWMIEDTPGKPNSNISHAFSEAPLLSVPSGFFYESFDVSLINKTDSLSTIYYTTNGSIPTNKDSIFAKNIKISETKTLRLRRYAEGEIPSEVTTYSYLFPDRAVTLPIISIVTDNRYFYDDTLGIYVDGCFDKDTFNFVHDWHRPIHLDYITEENELVLNQWSEIRIAGATSRLLPQKSLSLYSKKRLSGGDFNYSFWSEKPNITSTHSFLLRNSGNDFLRGNLRDPIIQSYAGLCFEDLDYQAYQPVIVYINGEYVGLMNLRERTNAVFVETNHPEAKGFDIIENWVQCNSGDTDEAIRFYRLIKDNNVTYEQLEKEMDVNEFLNLLIIEAYFGNIDFPDNNIVMWREKKEGAKWRWILKDLDYSMDYHPEKDFDLNKFTSNYFSQVLDDKATEEKGNFFQFSTLLFRKLCKTKEFQEKMIDKFSVSLGDFLHPRYIVKHVDSLSNKIEYEIPYTFERYSDFNNSDISDWYKNVEVIRNYSSKRNWLHSASMKEFFSLGNMYHLSINNPFSKDLPYTFTFNGIDMIHTSYEGYYYNNRTISIRTKKKQNAPDIKGWKIEKTINNGVFVEYQKGDSLNLFISENSEATDIKITICETTEEIKENTLECYNIAGGIMICHIEKNSTISVADMTGRTIIKETDVLDAERKIFLPIGEYILQVNNVSRKVLVKE